MELDIPEEPNSWRPLEWLEEPLFEPPYQEIRRGDDFLKTWNKYTRREACKCYTRAALAAGRKADLSHDLICASALAHRGDLRRRLARSCRIGSKNFKHQLKRSARDFKRAAELYGRARDDARCAVMHRLLAWVCIRTGIEPGAAERGEDNAAEDRRNVAEQNEAEEQACDSIERAIKLFQKQLDHLRYLGNREKITTYQLWIRELEKEAEDIKYLTGARASYEELERWRIEREQERISMDAAHLNGVVARLIGGEERFDQYLYQFEDPRHADEILRLSLAADYRVYPVECAEFYPPVVPEGELALVKHYNDNVYVFEPGELAAILVEPTRAGVTLRRVRRSGPVPGVRAPEKLVGKVVAFLKRAS